jgi:uncharacterized surface protein with fasciclin (FAS1) repeats
VPLAPLWDFIDSDPELTTFAEAVSDAGLEGLFDDSVAPSQVLTSVLAEPPPQDVLDLVDAQGITALAPTNSALAALPTWDQISADETALRHFVLAHVLPGQLDEAAILAATQVTALSGDVLVIDAGTQTINGAHLVVVDQLGTNGVAHTVDAVLVVPPVTPPTTEAPTTVAPEPPAEPPAAPEPTPTPPPGTA